VWGTGCVCVHVCVSTPTCCAADSGWLYYKFNHIHTFSMNRVWGPHLLRSRQRVELERAVASTPLLHGARVCAFVCVCVCGGGGRVCVCLHQSGST
jgi:hypothetical protein